MVHRTSQSLPTNFQLITSNQQIILAYEIKNSLRSGLGPSTRCTPIIFFFFSIGFKNITIILTLELNRSTNQ